MGRSVAVLSHYTHVTYFRYPMLEVLNEETGEFEESDEPEEWELFEESLSYLTEVVKGLEFMPRKSRRWDGDETSIMFEDDYCEIGVSEYCGLVSLAIRPNERRMQYLDEDEEQEFLKEAEKHIEEIWPIICANLGYKQYGRVGGFSDGTSVYSPIEN